MTPSIDRSHLVPVTSREHLIFLLNRASELEHGLACVYLFAAYSLKYEASEGGMTDDQLLMVRGWKRRLASVAVEEMLHLAQVSNLLTAIGGAPNFKRTNFPMSPNAFPLGIELSLEPFSQATIDRLVCFEMPEAGILSPEKQKAYDELRIAVDAAQNASSPGDASARIADQPFPLAFRTVGELYHQILTGFQNIPQDRLFIGPQQAQSNARYLDFGSKLISVVDADSARRAIEMIVEQGEAPTHDHPDAHFAVFDTIRKGYRSAMDDAAKDGTVFAPVRPVISNPMTRFYEDASGGTIITDPLTHDVADLFNLVYDTMLLMLVRFFAHLDEGDEELRMLSRGTLRMMASVLRPLGEALATMPAGPEFAGKTAGPGFGYNRDIALFPHKTSAWVFILERLHELVGKANTIAKSPACHPQVAEAAAALQSVGDHLIQYIPRQYAGLMDFHSTEQTAQPTIVCEQDGPYLVVNLTHLTNSKGEVLSTRRNLALCRCGGSALKPYCDGTHARIGFVSAKSAQRTEDKLAHYVGKEITIHDNRGTCCHSGNCTDHLPSVFNLKTEPLISPDAADAETIVNIIRQCPSGALSFTRNAKDYEGEQRDPAIFVSKDGPYHVQGGVGLQHEQRNEGASTEHYALCRCGHSKNKPFCDGTHWYVKFSDDDN
ncbi:MAG TPA: ferritin-like domain-containing protein [Candidatus Eremiobacteraceae bacterium]|jgi:CDGSH-type Zn-finger protein